VRRVPSTGAPVESVAAPNGTGPQPGALAWMLAWDQHAAPAALAALLQAGYRVQVTRDPLHIATVDGERRFSRGSLVIHRGLQDQQLDPVTDLLESLADRHGIDVYSVRGGLALTGPDLGAPSVPVLEPVRPALLVGPGLRATHAGYIWHWFDTFLEMPLVQLEHGSLWRVDLSDYSHIILPDGNYDWLPATLAERLAAYVRGGGILVAGRSASAWVEGLPLDWSFVEEKSNMDDKGEAPERRAYEDFQADFARQLIGGSALNVVLDVSHPLAFGYSEPEQVVFRRGRHRLRPVSNAYINAGVYADDVLASGYLSDETAERLAGTPALSATRHGEGLVIRMADDYLFRAYWAGTERLFANALFFGQLVRPTNMSAD